MKKILFNLLILTVVLVFSGNSFVLAQEEELSEETMQLSMNAYKTGVKMLKMRAYDSAINSFYKALEYNPKLSDAYYNIASIYVVKKDYDEAYNNYVKAIAINPNDYDSILQAAKIAYNKKNYSLTLKYLKYIPDDYEKYHIVQQIRKDATEQFDVQKGRIERAKISKSTPTQKVLIDKFEAPAGMVVDADGNMFVACYSDNAIVKIDKNKNRINYVKNGMLEGPVGLAIDEYDNIYVANFEADNILKITKSGNVSVFMEKVSKPYFLYIKDDILYISEQGNDVVIKYDLASSR